MSIQDDPCVSIPSESELISPHIDLPTLSTPLEKDLEIPITTNLLDQVSTEDSEIFDSSDPDRDIFSICMDIQNSINGTHRVTLDNYERSLLSISRIDITNDILPNEEYFPPTIPDKEIHIGNTIPLNSEIKTYLPPVILQAQPPNITSTPIKSTTDSLLLNLQPLISPVSITSNKKVSILQIPGAKEATIRGMSSKKKKEVCFQSLSPRPSPFIRKRKSSFQLIFSPFRKTFTSEYEGLFADVPNEILEHLFSFF